MRICIVLLLILPLSHAYDGVEYDEQEDYSAPFVHPGALDVRAGHEEYNTIQKYAKMPQYGTCWSAALQSLKLGCHQLTDDVQMSLAMQFANCFLEKSGMKICTCEEGESLQDCIQRSQVTQPNFFSSYLNFFTHTQSICFYLVSETWQRQAEDKVNRLMDASGQVRHQLEESHKIQSNILDKQKNALIHSEALVAHNEKLNETLMAQQRALVANFQDLQKATIEQRFWIADIADRISELKSYFIDGFTGFWATIFYFFSALAIWMLTGIRRTEKARVWLILLLGLFAAFEYGLKQKRLVDFESEPDGMPDARLISQYLHEEAWTIRRIFVLVAIGVLTYFFYSYEDEILSIRMEIGGMKRELQDLLGAIAVKGGNREMVDSASGVAGKVKDLMERASSIVRRSVTPTRETAPDSSMRVPNLPNITEEDDDEERNGAFPGRYRRSREVTPVDLSRLTPQRQLRSSVPKEVGKLAIKASPLRRMAADSPRRRLGSHQRDRTPDSATVEHNDKLQTIEEKNGTDGEFDLLSQDDST